MKTWIFLAALVASSAMSNSADAHWRTYRYWGYSGFGYGAPGYAAYYGGPTYVARRPYVGYTSYYGPVVRPYYAPRVVTYRPASYTSFYAGPGYAGPGGYYCGW